MSEISMVDGVTLMFGTIGGWEILMVFLAVLLLFGAKRLPEIARSMGKAINEFKKTKNDLLSDDEDQSGSDSKSIPTPDQDGEEKSSER